MSTFRTRAGTPKGASAAWRPSPSRLEDSVRLLDCSRMRFSLTLLGTQVEEPQASGSKRRAITAVDVLLTYIASSGVRAVVLT